MDDFERVVAALAGRLEGPLDGPLGSHAAFLLALARADDARSRALAALDRTGAGGPGAGPARFFRRAVDLVHEELGRVVAAEPAVAVALGEASRSVAGGAPPTAEAFWPAFFPEGVGLLGNESARIEGLRERRTVTVEALNEQPVADPTRELLLTSNVLLTLPAKTTQIGGLPYDTPLRRAIESAAAESQLYWYDHPIQLGVGPDANELLYGLRALDAAMAWERARDASLGRLRVVLSASVTHAGLRGLARDYVRHELAAGEPIEHLEVHLFTEQDTQALVEHLFAGDAGVAEVFGVDGEYGRHYSFLKAISALWQVVIDPAVRATFKIDLDQVFTPTELLMQTDASALGHLRSPLWGARGRAADGQPVELGMIAGALVNERDFGAGLFTPDVALADGPTRPDELVFCSRVPQAISTRAEMMERYDGPLRDGRRACLERIHVTGGTNGILVDALRRHQPFTPSFIGRAEDQAYILSVLDERSAPSPRLAYAHQAGLIMRHDKESFAGQAIEAARIGKLVGDDVRILYFSAYADELGRDRVKALIDPFTGCFASRLPVTVVALRLALRVKAALDAGDQRQAEELLDVGTRRLDQALAFSQDGPAFASALSREREAWRRYYDGLDRLERGIRAGAGWALAARERAQRIIGRTLLE